MRFKSLYPFPLMLRRARGFTLIELMIVVSIIGILAGIAVPKFANLITKSREAAVKYDLGAVRAALTIYYADNQFFPLGGVLISSLEGRYIEKFPDVHIPPPGDHPRQSAVTDFAGALTDSGGWMCDSTGADAHFFVDCTHTDHQNRVWSTW